MAACQATAADHCCTLQGQTCRYFDPEAVSGQNCTLRAGLGSWEAVYADGRYVRDVKPRLLEAGITVGCGDWPQNCPGLEENVRSGEVDPSAACCWGESWRP